jgi:competence protein ComEC
MALVIISLAFLAGIFLASVYGLMPPVVAATVLLIPLVPFVKRHRNAAIAAFFLIALAAGAVRFEFAKPYDEASEIAAFNGGGPMAIRGIIYREPEMSGKTLRLYLRVTERDPGWGWSQSSGNVLAFLPEYADYRYGDRLLVYGTLETPVSFDDFDYRGYLANQDIYTTVLYPKVTLIDRDNGQPLLAAIYDFKHRVAAALSNSLPEPQAALAKGILLGERGGIPQSVKDDFTISGTMHILAISGANLSIIAAMLAGLFTRLFGRRHGIYVILTLAIIWGYSVLTGLQPPVLRSAIMASVFLLAELLGRQKSALPALALTAAVMAIADPKVIWDVSFQLSFAAMAGLVLIYPACEFIGRKITVKLFGDEGLISGIAIVIAESIGMSLAASIAILPLTAYYFGTFSLVGLPATVLVLPVLPLIIFTTALTGLTGMILPPLAQVFGYVTWLPLTWLLLVTRTAADVPYAQFAVPEVSPGIIIAYYAALLLVLSATKSGLNKLKTEAVKVNNFLFDTPVKWALFPATLAVIVAVSAITSRPDGRLHVSFLDVGQGDAILIQQGTRQILVDGGPDAQTTLNALGKNMPFWDRDIELIVLTHPDADHITGLIEVVKRYNVGKVLSPDLDFTSQAGTAWLNAVEEKGIEQDIATPGQRIDFDNVTVEVILPKIPPDDPSVDASGVSLRVSEGNFSFLLTADITAATERELILEGADIQCTVLKVAHHGSAHGTSHEFLSVSDPEIAVISVGKDNKFGHPAPEVMQRLEDKVGKENMYRTDENGTVEFITDGEKLWVVKEK